MASSSSSSCNFHSEPPIAEQVITEFFAKSLHIILESRSPYVSSRNYNVGCFMSAPSSPCSPSSSRPRDKWFNLALRDCPAALENFDLWRQSSLEPLVIDIVLVRRTASADIVRLSPGGCLVRSYSRKDQQAEFMPETRREKIVERWIVQYESQKSSNTGKEMRLGSRKLRSGGSPHSSEIPNVCKKTYMGATILLRSLYVFVRLLPACNLFRELNSLGRIRSLSLSHRISSSVEPFTQVVDNEMKHFCFMPIDTPCGRLTLSVSFLPTLDDVSSEPSTPLSADFIVDYIGSPTTDPIRRFQSLPSAGLAPPIVPMSRQHSWSNEHGSIPSVSPPLSPARSDSHALNYNQCPRLPPRSHTHDNASARHKNNTSAEEYSMSPLFSPSPSSPGAHFSGGLQLNALLPSEATPTGILLPGAGWNTGGLPLPLKGLNNVRSCQGDALCARATFASPDSKVQIKKEVFELRGVQTDTSLQKVLSFGDVEARCFPGPKLLTSSSQRVASRASNQPSHSDELDDAMFVFAEDEDDTVNACSRNQFSEGKDQEGSNRPETRRLSTVRRSRDAVLGALLRLFDNAPPLGQDSSISSRPRILGEPSFIAQTNKLYSPASSICRSKTVTDALEELRSYKEIKDSILRQGKSDLDSSKRDF